MLNIDEIQNGIVIDHIKAGTAVGLMELLGITGNKTANVALIQNARSHKADCGRKDIIKVEGDASWLNLDVLAYLDPDISVTVIENGKAVRKEKPKPPKRLVNIVRCRNPRCISSIEEECDQIFEMSSNGKYRCIYLGVALDGNLDRRFLQTEHLLTAELLLLFRTRIRAADQRRPRFGHHRRRQASRADGRDERFDHAGYNSSAR